MIAVAETPTVHRSGQLPAVGVVDARAIRRSGRCWIPLHARYSDGDKPYICLNLRLKWLRSVTPTALQISLTGSVVVLIRRSAWRSLRSREYLAGLTPISTWNKR